MMLNVERKREGERNFSPCVKNTSLVYFRGIRIYNFKDETIACEHLRFIHSISGSARASQSKVTSSG